MWFNHQDSFEKGIIHGDVNEQNMLVREKKKDDGESGEYESFSVIDVGDSQLNCLVYELGITVMYMMTKCVAIDPNEVGGHVLAGYMTARRPTEAEFGVLRTCVAARFAQSLVMGAYSYSLDPGNEYLLLTAKRGWDLVRAFWALPKADLYKKWSEIIESYK